MRKAYPFINPRIEARKNISLGISLACLGGTVYSKGMYYESLRRISPFLSIISILTFSGCGGGISETTTESDEVVFLPPNEFGDQLIDHLGNKVDAAALQGKFLGLYFSAHWCPPCRLFTPKLVEFRDKRQDEFEVVFISSDNSLDEQLAYMREAKMKWMALPNGSDAGLAIAEKLQIQGIPTLVILGPDGKLITKNGRKQVMESPLKALDLWKKS